MEEDAEEEPAEPEEEKGSGGVAEKKEGDCSKPFSAEALFGLQGGEERRTSPGRNVDE